MIHIRSKLFANRKLAKYEKIKLEFIKSTMMIAELDSRCSTAIEKNNRALSGIYDDIF